MVTATQQTTTKIATNDAPERQPFLVRPESSYVQRRRGRIAVAALGLVDVEQIWCQESVGLGAYQR
jgi:hypothetical protein